MNRKVSVVFPFTSEDVDQALIFKKNHPEFDVKILAGSVLANLRLLQKSVNVFDQERLFSNFRIDYQRSIDENRRQSVYIFESLRSHFIKFKAFGINQIEVLRLLIEP